MRLILERSMGWVMTLLYSGAILSSTRVEKGLVMGSPMAFLRALRAAYMESGHVRMPIPGEAR